MRQNLGIGIGTKLVSLVDQRFFDWREVFNKRAKEVLDKIRGKTAVPSESTATEKPESEVVIPETLVPLPKSAVKPATSQSKSQLGPSTLEELEKPTETSPSLQPQQLPEGSSVKSTEKPQLFPRKSAPTPPQETSKETQGAAPFQGEVKPEGSWFEIILNWFGVPFYDAPKTDTKIESEKWLFPGIK